MLIPLVGHRYLPAEPCRAGNPVLSVHQTDIISYGDDLRRFFALEFGGMAYENAVRARPSIRFWGDFVE